MGKLVAHFKTLIVLSVRLPGPMPPIFTGRFDVDHFSVLVMPLARVKAHEKWSEIGVPMYSNLRMSNSAPGCPMSWLMVWLPVKWPIVRPSGFASLWMWLAAIIIPAPGMLSTMIVGLPGV